MLVLLGVMQAAAIIEGFGISLILPIIQGDQENNSRLSNIINWGFDLVSVTPDITAILIALIIFFILRAALLIGQSWYQARILSHHLIEMRSEFIKTVSKTDYQYLNSQDSGVLSNVMSGEITRVNSALAQLLNLMVRATTAIVYIALALLVAPVVTIFLCVLAFPVLVLMLYLNRITTRASLQQTDGSNRQQSFFLEAIRNIKHLKATGRDAIVIRRVLLEVKRVGDSFRKLTFLQGATNAGLEPIIVIVLASVIYFFTEIRGADVLEILFLLFVFRTAAVNMVATQPAYRKFISAAGSMKAYGEFRANILANREKDTSDNPSPVIGHGFEMREVSYTYPGQKSPALNNISALIPSNSTVAFVGMSGSGKTTAANIIASLLKPSSGLVYVGGTPYESININQLRRKIGYVTQESVVFNASLEDNITLWDGEPNSQKISDVVSKIGINKMIRTNPNNETLGDAGTSLSGGERQRLAIARELYWDTDILILDEATSSIDSVLEKQISQIIDSQRGTKTIIVIAHRLATIQNADLIFVFNGGNIVESGTFNELADGDGLFSNMVKMQSLQ